ALLSNVYSRQAIFEALERGDYFLRKPNPIRSADDLDDSQLKRCFEILHACHMASDADATLLSTRRTMEDFLDAVFEDWAADGEGELTKPKMDFVLRGYLKANQAIIEHFPPVPNLRAAKPLFLVSQPTKATQHNSTSASPLKSRLISQGNLCKTFSVPFNETTFAFKKRATG
ncbi:unnamed protein product, partial [Fusarium langsethiae]